MPTKLRGEAIQEQFKVRASNGEEFEPTRAIFPIFKHDADGSLRLLGTGFFITVHGIFVSAKHVFTDVIDEDGKATGPLSIIQFGENNTFYHRPVASCAVHGEADVAVGVCANMKHKVTGEPLANKVLTLSLTYPQIGETVFTYAYPGTEVLKKEKQEIRIAPRFYDGAVVDYFPKGRDRTMLPFPCYQTSIYLHGGASGGPVFSENGRVIGVNSTGYEGGHDISFISRIQDIYDLELHDVVFLDEKEPRRVSIRELVPIRHIAVG